MLWDWLKAVANDARRGDERAVDCRVPGTLPPVLRRQTVYALALIAWLAVVYGTLAPFVTEPGTSWRWWLGWHRPVPGDAAANVLLYVPLGILARLIVRRRGSAGWTDWLLVLPPLIGLSYLSEACQTVLRYRVGSWTDVTYNTLGAVVGLGSAPHVQRILRNQHAWFYYALRTRPYHAAAAAVVGCMILGALMPFDFRPTPLMPFDFRPTPHQLMPAVARFGSTSLTLPWTSPGTPAHVLSVSQQFDKMLAAAGFGLAAFWLVLSAREAGRPREQAVGYALTRTLLLVVLVESLQSLTTSHAADPRDLLVGWACTGAGAAIASRWLARRGDHLPSPVALLRGFVGLAAAVLATRLLLSACTLAGHAWPGMNVWLPMAGTFGCSWHRLMTLYCTSLAQYVAVGMLAGLWMRTRGRWPGHPWIVGTVLAASAAAQGLALWTGHPPDTSQSLLALAGAVFAVRLDRALFGVRKPAVPPGAGRSRAGRAV